LVVSKDNKTELEGFSVYFLLGRDLVAMREKSRIKMPQKIKTSFMITLSDIVRKERRKGTTTMMK
jgi:hypothetical protein